MLNDIIVNPKKDGRVEIPQSIVKIMGWEFHNKLYAYKNKDELILSFEKKSFGELLGTLKVSNKRIRVPSTFLKKTGLKNDISISCKLDSIILKIEYTNIDEIAKKIADKLNDSQAIALLNVLKNRFPENISIKGSSPVRLFLPETTNHLVFRPVDIPYRFSGYYLLNNKIVYTNNINPTVKPDYFFLLPGIKRLKDRFYETGFLLVNERLYGRILFILSKANLKTPVGRDLILWYDPIDVGPFGSFKVYTNPPEALPEEIVNRAREDCSNPQSFLENNFNKFTYKVNNLICPCPDTLSKNSLSF